MRRHQGGRLTLFGWGAITLGVIVVLTYFGFTKALPFRSHYEVKAAFHTANNIRPNSFVRIAGVNVGKVVKVEHIEEGSESALVTMRIDDKGRPLRKDATFTIRPRIFLEGNFFVDVQPGSSSAPELEDGGVVPANQTATPVQLDQILTALQTDTREDLKVLLDELSTAVDGDGARGYRNSIPYWEPAHKGIARVNEGLLGQREHDLSNYVASAGAVAESLDRNRNQLKSLITDFNTTAAAFAREKGELERAIEELPRTVGEGGPALASLNESFPGLRNLADELRPAVRSSEPALREGTPLLAQLNRLTSRAELGGLVTDLAPGVPALVRLTQRNVPLMEQTRAASSCQNEVILPWTRDKVQDEAFPAKGPVYQEGVQFLPGINGESHSGDANGQWFRILTVGGNYTLFDGTIAASMSQPITGVNPPKPVNEDGTLKRPDNKPNVPCETQEKPDLRSTAGAPPAQFKNPPLTGAAKARYEKSRLTAIKWLQEQLDSEGLGGKVSLKDLTLDDIKKMVAAKKAREAAARKLIKGKAR